jgi:hypothetical protein
MAYQQTEEHIVSIYKAAVRHVKLTGYSCLHRPFVSLHSAMPNFTPFQKCKNIIAMDRPCLVLFLYLLFPIAAQTINNYTALQFKATYITKMNSIIFSLKIEQ